MAFEPVRKYATSPPNYPHPVGFAVADINGSISIHKYAVRSGHPARPGVSFGAVPSFSGAGHQLQGAPADVNHANRVAFRIGKIDVAIRSDAQTLRSGERSPVARVRRYRKTPTRRFPRCDEACRLSNPACKRHSLPAVPTRDSLDCQSP